MWFPAQWPETYSYTLSAAIDAGLPIVATRIGAFPERLEGRPLTWLVDPEAPAEEWLAVFDKVRGELARQRKPPTGKPRQAGGGLLQRPVCEGSCRSRPSANWWICAATSESVWW